MEVSGQCPKCGAATILTYWEVDIRMMNNAPRQMEPYIRVTHWQCRAVMTHQGDSDPFPSMLSLSEEMKNDVANRTASAGTGEVDEEASRPARQRWGN